MAIWGVNLAQADKVKNDIERIFNIISTNSSALDEIKTGGRYYHQLKEYFCDWVKFIHTVQTIPKNTAFYRVRKLDEETKSGITNVDGLKYRKEGGGLGRMSNHSLNVMYTSYNEYTAISECKLKENDWFQLTKFKSTRIVKYFELGLFSKLYFTLPRDSDIYKSAIKELFGESDGLDTTVRGFAALESALMDGLYAKHDDPEMSHLVSSVIADAIFTIYDDIDAVLFPSLQQRFGINVSFREKAADELDIRYSCINQIDTVFKTSMYKYRTHSECIDFTKIPLQYNTVEENSIWHACYR